MYWLLIILLLIPQIGYAECEGWILWFNMSYLKAEGEYLNSNEWTVENSYQTLSQCKVEQETKWRKKVADGKPLGWDRQLTPILLLTFQNK